MVEHNIIENKVFSFMDRKRATKGYGILNRVNETKTKLTTVFNGRQHKRIIFNEEITHETKDKIKYIETIAEKAEALLMGLKI